ncbi:MAG: ribbon-helix-helix domain-containing protein [Pseudomonadota bacterium]
MTAPKKRSVTLAGHRTSLSIEEEFWDALRDLADRRGRSLNSLLTEIDAARGDRNLSSAVRVYVLQQALRKH